MIQIIFKSHWILIHGVYCINQIGLNITFHSPPLSQISPTDFDILLEYLEGLKGKARETTIEQAEQIIKAADHSDDDDSENEEGDKMDEKKSGKWPKKKN